MNNRKRIEIAVNSFMDAEDIDEGYDNLRREIRNLEEMRYAIAHARQDHSEDETALEDLIECLTSL